MRHTLLLTGALVLGVTSAASAVLTCVEFHDSGPCTLARCYECVKQGTPSTCQATAGYERCDAAGTSEFVGGRTVTSGGWNKNSVRSPVDGGCGGRQFSNESCQWLNNSCQCPNANNLTWGPSTGSYSSQTGYTQCP